MSFVEAPPQASILIESMRDIGYSLETAIADVIDNSITAGATQIDIRVDPAAAGVKVGIVDNGRGLTRPELLESMRLGSRNPLDERPLNDLGRFGLGLKTASFSQCRRLSVASRRLGETTAAIWDLDHVARENRWSLQLPDDLNGIPFIEHLGAQGTLVVWEKLDRAFEQEGTEAGRRHFVRRIDETRRHLELVFHRYLTGERGARRVAILINDLPLKPFDPFHSHHPATIRGQIERVQVGNHVVEITAFTLPHHRNVSAAEWDHYGGTAGYLKNQGFYLYREKRLIVHGTWFGLARQTELTKLTRVQIDMPNALDAEWHVDVKKASARPPLQVRERLQRIIEQIGAPSRHIYTQRGRRLHDSRLPLWERVQDNNAIVYRLNADNPIVGDFRSGLAPGKATDFDRFLQLVSGGLPMDAIFADLAGSPEAVQAAQIDDNALEAALEVTYAGLRQAGITPVQIPQMLRVSEPFRSNWEKTESLLDQMTELTKE